LQALEAREQPVSDWYKDEGGRGNVLRFTVGAPVRLTERVRLGAQLMYEDGSLVEDAEETLTMVTQPGAMALTPEMPEVTIEFRIEKVSRRKDGRRFCLQVAPMYDPGALRPRDGFFAPIVSQPINVLSKRKPGEREVTRVQRRPMVDAPDDSAAHFKMLHGTMLQLQKTVDEVKALEKRNAKRLDMLTAFITSGGGSTAPAGLLMQLGAQLPRDDSSASTGSALGGRGVRGAGMGAGAGVPVGVPPMLRSDSLGDLPLSNYGAAPITSWDLGNGANPASSSSAARPAAEGAAGAGDGPGASSGKPSRGRHGTGASDSKTTGDGDAFAGASADAAAPRTGGRGKRGAKAGSAAASAAAPGTAAADTDGIDGADVSLPGSLRPALLPGLSMASDAGDAAEGASGDAAGDSAASSSGSVGPARSQPGAAAAGSSSSVPLLGGLSAASGLLMLGPGGSQLHRGISMGGAFDDVIAQGTAGGAVGPGFPFGSLPLPGGHPSLARGLSRQISVGDPVSLMEALYRDGEGALMGAAGYGGQPGKETPRTASIMGMTHHLQSPLGQLGARAGAGATAPGAKASSDMGGGISSVATGSAPKEGSGAAPKRAKVEVPYH
jgi:hypothetical protein